MRRHMQILAVLAAFFSPCAAQAFDAAKINQAADAFVALAKDSNKTGNVPRQTDPAAKPLLDTVLNTKEIEGVKPLPWTQFKPLADWNAAVRKIGFVYYLAGTGASDLVALSKDPKGIEKANQNAVTYAPEFGRYYDAQIRLHSAMIDAAVAEAANAKPEERKDPDFRGRLLSISLGATEAMTGLLGTFVLPGMPEDWQLLRVVTLLEITPKAAKFMTPEDRERVKISAAEVAGSVKNPDVKSGLNTIARAFAML